MAVISPTRFNLGGRASKNLADFIVENRTCSMLDDKIGRFYQPTKSAKFVDRLTSPSY